ncbi:hypothetical protein [Halobacillus litoralis]|uniref:HAMP domain-containing protein n=1 Tax=Halobacillus litoralis TaxID=45668 RepID=UPI001CFD1F1A|nr:hypothetical protein [Halobacillus litoralis]
MAGYKASRQVSEGNYDVHISNILKEKEIAELTQTFTDMAGKLKKLQHMRTELLAGVRSVNIRWQIQVWDFLKKNRK